VGSQAPIGAEWATQWPTKTPQEPIPPTRRGDAGAMTELVPGRGQEDSGGDLHGGAVAVSTCSATGSAAGSPAAAGEASVTPWPPPGRRARSANTAAPTHLVGSLAGAACSATADSGLDSGARQNPSSSSSEIAGRYFTTPSLRSKGEKGRLWWGCFVLAPSSRLRKRAMLRSSDIPPKIC